MAKKEGKTIMTTLLRTCLIMIAIFSISFIIHRIRGAKVRLQDTVFWMFTSAILLILGIFPPISFWAASLLGFQSSSNFVFFIMICFLFEKSLTLSILQSRMEENYSVLVAELALRTKELDEQLNEIEEFVQKGKSSKVSDEKLESSW